MPPPAPQAGRQADADRALAWLVVLSVVVVGLLGCARTRVELPLVGFAAEAVGTKMVRPRARARACRTTVLGMALDDATSPIDDALRTLRELDPEVDTLVNVRIEATLATAGILERTCVTVEADAVRAIPVVRLPAPDGQHRHH